MARRKRKNRKGKTKVCRFLQKLGKGTVSAATFLPLLPFKIAMQTILRGRGVKPEKKIDRLAQQFYNIVVQKKEGYEVVALENLAGDVIGSIVKAIINYFKDLKKKKESGVKLPPAEEKALQVAENTVEKVVEIGKEETKSEIAQKSFTPLLITSVLAVVLLFAFAKSKK